MDVDVSDGEDGADLNENGENYRDEPWVDISARCWIFESVLIPKKKMSSLLSH